MRKSFLIPIIVVDFLLVGGVFAYFFLSADSPADLPKEGPPAASGPVQGDYLVAAISAGMDTGISMLAQGAASYGLRGFLTPLLTKNNFDCRMTFEPNLAKEWEWDETGTVLTISLRDDFFWEDGVSVNADDVVFTFALLAKPELASPRSFHLDSMRKDKPVEKLGEFKVAFYFRKPFDRSEQLAYVTEIGIVPHHVLKDIPPSAIRRHEFNRKPLSGGPMRLERMDGGQEIVFARNEKHPHARPFLDKVIWRIIPSYTTQIAELLAGGVDMVEVYYLRDLGRLMDHPEIRVIPVGNRFLDYIIWNFENPLFQDVRVRRALAHAVDAQKLIDAFLSVKGKAFGRRSVGLITPELCGYGADSIRPLDFDPSLARTLFQEAGWRDTDGDGILDRDGVSFSFRLLTFAENPQRLEVCEAVQGMLREVGVDAQLEKREFVSAVNSLKNGRFDAACIGWQAQLWVNLKANFHSADENVFNYGSFSDSAVDQKIEAALEAENGETAKALWAEVERSVYEEQPALFLYWFDRPVAIHHRFRDVKSNLYDQFHDFEHWWVPENLQKYP